MRMCRFHQYYVTPQLLDQECMMELFNNLLKTGTRLKHFERQSQKLYTDY